MSKDLVLLYPMDPKQSGKIKSLMLFMGVGVREVKPEEYGLAVGALAGRLPEGTPGQEVPKVAIEKAMMVLCMPQGRVSQVVDRFRRHKQPLPTLTAALTDTNSAWSSYGLYHELSLERAAFATGGGTAHQPRE